MLLIEQWSAPARPQNEVGDNFSKVENQALSKALTLKDGSRTEWEIMKTTDETAELGIASVRLVLVSFFFFPSQNTDVYLYIKIVKSVA